MFEIRPNVLYSREDLEKGLGEMMSLETFLGVVEPLLPTERKFKSAYWGSDLIEALSSRPASGGPSSSRSTWRHRPFRRKQPRLVVRIQLNEKRT